MSSSPADGASLDQAPSRIELSFSEDMSAPAYVVVTSPTGESIASRDPVVEGDTVVQDVSAGHSEGRYSVAFRVFSVDGHPVSGQLSFTVGPSPGEPVPTDQPVEADPSGGGQESGPTSDAANDDAGEALAERLDAHAVTSVVLFGIAIALWLASRRVPR